MPVRGLEYHEDSASCWVSKAYACKAWNRLTDIDKDQMNLQAMDKQNALIAKNKKVVAGERVVAMVSAVNNDALLCVNEDDD